jgi:hypothetical protein
MDTVLASDLQIGPINGTTKRRRGVMQVMMRSVELAAQDL